MPATMNALFEWKDAYSVNIPEIDTQHKELFRIAKELNSAMSAGHGAVVLTGILERLIAYTRKHFAHEERLMQLYKYPDSAAHKGLHDRLTKQVLDFQRDFQAGRLLVTLDIMRFLHNWLENHILKSDKHYAPCLSGTAQTV
jgi:hemerythrin